MDSSVWALATEIIISIFGTKGATEVAVESVTAKGVRFANQNLWHRPLGSLTEVRLGANIPWRCASPIIYSVKGVMGNNRTIGEAFHITSDEWLTWNQLHEIAGRAAGAPTLDIVHVPTDLINAFDPAWGAGLLGDKSASMVFDNTKIKRISPEFMCTVPWEQGAQEMVEWYDGDASRRVVDGEFDALTDRIIAAYEGAFPV